MHRPALVMILLLSSVPAARSAPTTAPSTTAAAAAAPLRERFRSLLVSDPAAVSSLADAAAAGGDEAEALRRWLAANRQSVEGAKPGPLPATRWGGSTLDAKRPDTLYLHVLDHHASGKVIAYGLSADNVRRAYWLGDPRKDLKVERTPRDTIVELTAKNAKAPDPFDTVVVLECDGGPKVGSLAVPPQPDGSVLLHSRQAVVVGRNLRYEPEPHKDTVGYWFDPADWVYWEFKTEKPGAFDVEMLQGCGKNSGGSDVEVAVDDGPPLPMVVQDTGHFQNFVPRVIGRVKLDPGTHTLAVKVKQKKGAAVMDLRQVTLKPVP